MKNEKSTRSNPDGTPVDDEEEADNVLLDNAINHFNKQLEDIEKRCHNSNEYSNDLLEEITQAIIIMGAACEEFDKNAGQNTSIIRETQIRFREKTHDVFSKSYLMNHARTWPLGYPGDYTMLEDVYSNTPKSEGIGYYLDEYFLSTTLAVAVRERKETLRELLKTELENRKKPKILNIACGSCREIFQLSAEIEKSEAKVMCIDFDPRALDFSTNLLSSAGLVPDRVECRKYNALKMVNQERNLEQFGKQDVIYSIGLFDYLNNDVLIALLKSLTGLLNDGGKFMATFKDSRSYKTFDYHWLVSWDAFIQRTEDDVRSLFEKAGISSESLAYTRDHSGVIFFTIATK
ncbi:MAG TPA: hypothetical protein DCO77_02695 [Nitrospiraceae bacterium]|nr:hypothetical protein [Nitrospiraceae bacterium]